MDSLVADLEVGFCAKMVYQKVFSRKGWKSDINELLVQFQGGLALVLQGNSDENGDFTSVLTQSGNEETGEVILMSEGNLGGMSQELASSYAQAKQSGNMREDPSQRNTGISCWW